MKERPGVCGFEGNNDLYGLGIRLGLYFQVFATILAANYLPSMSRHVRLFRMAGTALGVSTFIVIVMESAKKNVKGVEVNSILWMVSLNLFSAAKRTSFFNFDLVGCLHYITLTFPLAIYLLWFWFHGLDILPRSECNDEYAFFFAKVSLWHWFRNVSKAMNVILGVYILITLLVAVVCTSWIKKLAKHPNFQNISEVLRGSNIDVSLFKSIASTLASYGSLAAITIFPAELMIRWNKVSGVNSLDTVGQLVPFVLGFGQFLDVLCRIMLKVNDEADEEVESDEDVPCSSEYQTAGQKVADA